MVTVSNANIRGGPGTSYAIVATAVADTELPVLEKDSGWLKVQLPDEETGWIYGTLVQLKTVESKQPENSGGSEATETPDMGMSDELTAVARDLPAGQVLNKSTGKDYWILQNAIEEAEAGQTLLLAPGRYPGRIRLDKELNLIGAGKNQTTLEMDRDAKDSVWIQDKAPRGIMAHLTIKGGKNKPPVLEINGKYEGIIFQCRILGGKGASALISDEAKPRFQQCEFMETGDVAIEIRGKAAPVLESNYIHNGQGGGIRILEEAAPLLQGNRINEMESFGIQIGGTARPKLEANVVQRCQLDGIFVFERAAPTLIRNSIFSNAQKRNDTANLFFEGDSAGTVQENTIAGSLRRPGILIRENAHPYLVDNTITRNKVGLSLEGRSYPTLKENNFADNELEQEDLRSQ